jgi:hypothetical protein
METELEAFLTKDELKMASFVALFAGQVPSP